MSTHLTILSKKEIRAFDLPPEFNGEERKRFFHLPQWAMNLVLSLRSPTNKVGFALQLGYFNAVNKFFVAHKFHPTDIEFVQRRLSLPLNSVVQPLSPLEEIDWSKYVKATFTRHQQIIVDNLGFHKFNPNAKSLLMGEALKISAKQMKPKLMFWSLVDFLREKKIELPSYYALAEIISDALGHFETGLLATIEQHISPKEKHLLDELLEIDPEYESEAKQDLKLKRYKLTLLKKSNQSTKPSRIKENVNDLLCLKELFEEVSSLTKQIDLSPEIIQYYGGLRSKLLSVANISRAQITGFSNFSQRG